MRAFDANIVLRLILRDHEKQTAQSTALAEEPFMLLPTVLLEVVWVLGSKIGKQRTEIAFALRTLIGHPNAHTQAREIIGWALDRFEAGADFADVLHVGFAAAADASSFATFDQKIQKRIESGEIAIETFR